MIQVNRIYLIFNRLVTKKFLVDTSVPLKVIKLETREQAQNSPTPATIFSLFYNGKFVTTDLSICTESKFTKLLK